MQVLYFLLPLDRLLECILGNWLLSFCSNCSMRQACLYLTCRSVKTTFQFSVASAVCVPRASWRGVGLRPRRNAVLGDFVRPLGVGEQLALRPFDNRSVGSGRDWLGATNITLRTSIAQWRAPIHRCFVVYLHICTQVPFAQHIFTPQSFFSQLLTVAKCVRSQHAQNLLSKVIQCYHQVNSRCVPSFLHFAWFETNLL